MLEFADWVTPFLSGVSDPSHAVRTYLLPRKSGSLPAPAGGCCVFASGAIHLQRAGYDEMAVRGLPIGVTGGIGAGKTTVLSLLAELGARTVDADDVVHDLYQPGQPGQEAVRERWGNRVLTATGRVDRTALAELVFTAPGELRWLNGVIHPRVRERIWSLADESDGPLFCGIPLLFETGWESSMWRSVTVWCSRSVQWRRLRLRGWDEMEIRRRLVCQMDMDEKLVRGDFGIINNGGWEQLREQCRILVGRLQPAA